MKKMVIFLTFLISIGTAALFSANLFQTSNAAQIEVIDVPLENQNDEPSLGNGCEITALSMLLRYYGYDTNKNQLAELLEYVPVTISNELHGNPHDGFVGDITGGLNAMGVAVEPIAKVAETIVTSKYHVITKKELPFSSVEKLIHQGTPVWVETTVDFQVPQASDFRYWNTLSGTVKVTPLCHAAVITGVDANFVYVNDPYGHKNRAVDKTEFIEIYNELGKQSLYLQGM
ncbi:hypothetical protein IGI37_001452 [Enterococcus sp. AZ194]|uniref:C39 family peptidase n=1 Tax=Enterococcus sp. AZ194 TaxID=2774629 RepID=UPI003F22F862